jgi:flagellar biosynthetic protein FliR
MISFSYAQLSGWLAILFFPFARILGLLIAAPVFSNTAVSPTVVTMLAVALDVALAPVLPPMPAIPAGSWIGLAILAQQFFIGVFMGFTVRVAFLAVDLAGNLVGLEMGLSFAVFYDPQGTGQTPVMAEFLSLVATLLFLAMNGHLLVISALAESFTLLPVSTTPFAAKGIGVMLGWAGTLFSTGVLLSLPLVAALLIANIAMGVLSRVAPQLNLFAVGFPVTMAAGFAILMISMPYFGAALERVFGQSFDALQAVLRAGGAAP